MKQKRFTQEQRIKTLERVVTMLYNQMKVIANELKKDEEE